MKKKREAKVSDIKVNTVLDLKYVMVCRKHNTCEWSINFYISKIKGIEM